MDIVRGTLPSATLHRQGSLLGTDCADGFEDAAGIDWGNATPPSSSEMVWIRSFGEYPEFDPDAGRISQRVSLEIANLKAATRIVVYHHYLHRGRTMAQLPYWIRVDDRQVGVLLFSYPRLSVPICGIQPLNLLELARLWIHPSLQGRKVTDSMGRTHAVCLVSCAIGLSLRRVQHDWASKYPQLPGVAAIVSWADDVHHEGTIYKASNFEEMGKSGGSMHGNRRRNNGGTDKLNPDYAHPKTMFLYRFEERVKGRESVAATSTTDDQLSLFDTDNG